MSFLTINGIDVPIADSGSGSSSAKRDTVGAGITRAADGSARNSYQGKKWHPSLKTIALAQADALFLAALIDGLGDHWNFDADLNSDKGSAPTSSNGCSADATHVRFGAKALLVQASPNALVVTTDPLDKGWGVLVWRWNGAAFDHYIVTRATAAGAVSVYKNGVVQAPGMPTWLSVDMTANTVTLEGAAGANSYFDDLVVIPAYCPADLVASLYAFLNTQAWPFHPKLQVAGDAMPNSGTVLMLGETTGFTTVTGNLGSGQASNNLELQFDLNEA